MSILHRAGLAHLADRLPPDFAADSPDPERLDLVGMRREQARRYLAGHRCHARFGDATLCDPGAAGWVRQILADDPKVAPTLLLIGATGSGKSRLAWAVLSAVKLGRAEQGRGLRCWMVGHADLNAETRPRPDDEHVAAFERYATAELLVLDDLAATRATEWTEETLYRLIERRWLVKAPTVVVTNHSIRRAAQPSGGPDRSPLERAVGDRVASRILDATVVSLTGPDRRLADARARAQVGEAS